MLRPTLILVALCCFSAYVHCFEENPFECEIKCKYDPKYKNRPTSVNRLTPCDIEVIGAIGDGDTSARWAQNVDVQEYGLSYSTGAQNGDLDEQISLANILRKYNKQLKGISLGPKEPGFNLGYQEVYSDDALVQAEKLVYRMKEELRKGDQFNKGWKIVTLWIGSNDACGFCKNSTLTVEKFVDNLRNTLDYLQKSLPRTLIALSLNFPYSEYRLIENGNCPDFQDDCPCAFEAVSQHNRFVDNMNIVTQELIDTGRYSNSETFAVVIQPFMQRHSALLTLDDTVDRDYYAKDCWHATVKGQEAMGAELWNNLIQPVGQKSSRWSIYLDKVLSCPTTEFIPTRLVEDEEVYEVKVEAEEYKKDDDEEEEYKGDKYKEVKKEKKEKYEDKEKKEKYEDKEKKEKYEDKEKKYKKPVYEEEGEEEESEYKAPKGKYNKNKEKKEQKKGREDW